MTISQIPKVVQKLRDPWQNATASMEEKGGNPTPSIIIKIIRKEEACLHGGGQGLGPATMLSAPAAPPSAPAIRALRAFSPSDQPWGGQPGADLLLRSSPLLPPFELVVKVSGVFIVVAVEWDWDGSGGRRGWGL